VPDTSFPDGFLWGTATAAHQVEGNNWNNDWWAWEHTPGSGCTEPSGDACDQWERWAEDLELLRSLNFGAYRFSVEWARIEPEEGEFSAAALDHYRRLCARCWELGVQPIVTLHHFTSPRWVAAAGGWADPATADRFGRFAARTAGALGDVVSHWCTINEPNWLVTNGYFLGHWPPGEKGGARAGQATATVVAAHRRAVEAVRSSAHPAPVGMAAAMTDFHAVDGGDERRDQFRKYMEDVWLDATAGDDFLGVQVYTRLRVGPEGALPNEEGVRATLMGYEFWPEALEACLRRAHEVTGLPLMVTENGIGTNDDAERIEYVERALQGVLRALADGIPVKGYLYWSLLDNFEWDQGYGPTFGLVAVDRATQARSIKASARWLAQVAAANGLPAG
jgi:beta-glucosidase